jgi:hypothetical protein
MAVEPQSLEFAHGAGEAIGEPQLSYSSKGGTCVPRPTRLRTKSFGGPRDGYLQDTPVIFSATILDC